MSAKRFSIAVDHSRDVFLTDFSKQTLKDRYLLPGESYQDLFARVACTYADDKAHAERLYQYMSLLWFMPATPVLANGGTTRGLPISCFLNEVEDNLEGIVGTWNENVWLASSGGGIGTYWGNVRAVGESIGARGESSGIMPFLKVMDSQTLAVSQGSLRRGSAAVYLDVSHPEIEEFIEMRRPTGGDTNRKSLNLHHAVVIPDVFMHAVEKGETWNLVSPKNGAILKTLDARALWVRLLTARIETGEPYFLFVDTVNKHIPEHHKVNNLEVKTSNLCLTGDTRIVTTSGIKTLQELFDSQEEFSVVSDLRTLEGAKTVVGASTLPRAVRYPDYGVGTYPSSKVVKIQSDAPIYSITTAMGRTLSGTADHQVMTPQGWRKIIDLQAEDEICVQSGEGIWTENRALPAESQNVVVKRMHDSFLPPSEWSAELGELLGWLIGDGYIATGANHPSFVFGDKEEHLLPYFQEILEKWFPGRTCVSRSANCPHLIVTSKPAGDFFQSLGVKVVRSDKKTVPAALFSAPRDAVRGFLRGIFSSDGMVVRCRDAGQVGLGSTAREMLEGVQILLGNFGINSTIYFRKGHSKTLLPSSNREVMKEYKTKPAWELRIGKANRNRFMEEIGFIHSYKQDNLIDFASQQTKRGAYRDRFTDRVVSVDVDGFADVFDIHVAESHSFIANGIVVHNCNEITLFTGRDHHGEMRTAVCCLSSLNLDTYMSWKDTPKFIEDVMRFLDNVLQDFIDRAPPSMAAAIYSATQERSVGLGVMGFHSFLQSQGVPFESPSAIAWNKKIFKHIQDRVEAADRVLADERGPCPDAEEAGFHKRFSNKTSIAPTASISIICGGVSPCIEPWPANVFTQKTLSGSFPVRNTYLSAVLNKYGKNTKDTWDSIVANKGSVQHLEFLTDWEKATFKTAIELDQNFIIRLAADRQPFIDQGQSVNLFFPADTTKKELHEAHMRAWKSGLKGLYYCRSLSVQRAEVVSEKIPAKNANDGEVCEVCQ
jgi:ribonucleotide reductase alpha subunit